MYFAALAIAFSFNTKNSDDTCIKSTGDSWCGMATGSDMHIKDVLVVTKCLWRYLDLYFIHYYLSFPWSQSIADVNRKRQGDKTLKNVRKFERLDHQVRKCQLDIEFLNTYHKYNVIPNFLRFHVTNKTLKDSLTYSRCQQLLLNEEIRCKTSSLRQLMFEYDRIKQELQCQLSPTDFMHVSSMLLVLNEKVIGKNDKIQGRKLQNS